MRLIITDISVMLQDSMYDDGTADCKLHRHTVTYCKYDRFFLTDVNHPHGIMQGNILYLNLTDSRYD